MCDRYQAGRQALAEDGRVLCQWCVVVGLFCGVWWGFGIDHDAVRTPWTMPRPT